MQKVLVLHDFMLKDSKLKGSRLLVYALIYGFITNCDSFTMSPQKVCDFLGIKKTSFYEAIKFLTDNNYLLCNGSKISLYDYNNVIDKAGCIDEFNEETIKIARFKWVNI